MVITFHSGSKLVGTVAWRKTSLILQQDKVEEKKVPFIRSNVSFVYDPDDLWPGRRLKAVVVGERRFGRRQALLALHLQLRYRHSLAQLAQLLQQSHVDVAHVAALPVGLLSQAFERVAQRS